MTCVGVEVISNGNNVMEKSSWVNWDSELGRLQTSLNRENDKVLRAKSAPQL